jgi:sigma-B regulation protein RsbU (phosphoserine phosphatase)
MVLPWIPGCGEFLGLGLFIAAEIARAHDGELEVSSDENETRFTFTAPPQ